MGTGYVLSRDLALAVAQTRHVRNYRHNRFEDVNVGAILASYPFKRVDLPANRENVCSDDLILLTPVVPDGMRHLYNNDVAKVGSTPPPSRCHEYDIKFPIASEAERAQIHGNIAKPTSKPTAKATNSTDV